MTIRECQGFSEQNLCAAGSSEQILWTGIGGLSSCAVMLCRFKTYLRSVNGKQDCIGLAFAFMIAVLKARSSNGFFQKHHIMGTLPKNLSILRHNLISFCKFSLLPASAFVSSFGPTLVHMRHVTATARSQFSRQPMSFLSLQVL